MERSDHPKMYIALDIVEGAFQKNTTLFQFAIGSVLLSSLITILFKEFETIDDTLRIHLWILLISFLLYVAFIILEWLRSWLTNNNLLNTKVINQYDKFLTVYSDFLQRTHEGMVHKDLDLAFEFLERGLVFFNVVNVSDIDKKLSSYFNSMSTMASSTRSAIGNKIAKAEKTEVKEALEQTALEIDVAIDDALSTIPSTNPD